MISLSAAYLGDLGAGGYIQCAALTQNLARTAAANLPTTPLDAYTRQLFDDNENCHTCFVNLFPIGYDSIVSNLQNLAWVHCDVKGGSSHSTCHRGSTKAYQY